MQIYGIDDVGFEIEISFVTDKKPTKKNIAELIKLLESTKDERSLKQYYSCVKFNRVEDVVERGE